MPGLRLLALLVLAVLAGRSWGYLTVELKNGSKSMGNRYKYEDDSLFTYRYANLPNNGKRSGYVWKWDNFPVNGCQYIPPLPYSALEVDDKWFALIENISACGAEMIKNVRNAGFQLILGYDAKSSSPPSLSQSLRKRDFPIVAVSRSYATETLWQVAATNDSLERPIKVYVTVMDLDTLVVGFACGFFVFFLSLAIICCCIFYCRWRSRRRGLYEVAYRANDRFDQRYAEARRARQELIENILRQLQELQIEPRQHTPLGEAATRALPQKTFAKAQRESAGNETCAICMEEFKDKDQTRILPCKHLFHPQCIDPWLIERSSMCPLCKQSVSSQDEGASSQQQQRGSLSLISDASSGSDTTFGTPTAPTPAVPLTDVTNSPSPALPVRGSSVNNDSSSASSDAPLISTYEHSGNR